MRRRRRAMPHASHERWLVSYADFITLLFAFFVVLYAAAEIDKKKIGQVAASIQVAFQQMGAFLSGRVVARYRHCGGTCGDAKGI